MSWNKNKASSYARWHAGSSSSDNCAMFVRQAIEAGGLNIGRTGEAKDYASLLESAGFRSIGSGETPQEGDVVVIQPYPGGRPEGHMAIFDGTNWFSDFQQRDMWGGPGYRSHKPPYIIYRKD
ncbi:C40 family peptidase [Escherichia coli]|nr:C40 family peptidase [Escherichia coli]